MAFLRRDGVPVDKGILRRGGMLALGQVTPKQQPHKPEKGQGYYECVDMSRIQATTSVYQALAASALPDRLQ